MIITTNARVGHYLLYIFVEKNDTASLMVKLLKIRSNNQVLQLRIELWNSKLVYALTVLNYFQKKRKLQFSKSTKTG